MNFTQDELYRLSECILAKMSALNTCYKVVTTRESRDAINAELDDLKELNSIVCSYMIDERGNV